jgi:hypothetical protein
MRPAVFVVFLFTASRLFTQTIQQNRSNPESPAWQAFYTNQAEIRKRGQDALQRERDRRKANLCSKASNGNAGIGLCLSTEIKITESNYLTYIRAIGGLLRLSTPDEPVTGGKTVKRIPFDDGESSWQSYREQNCRATSTQWQGSSASVAYADCRLKVTWNHLEELADLYGDLWH